MSSASDGQDKAEYVGLDAAGSIVVLAIQPARAGQFSSEEEAQDDDHLAQFLEVCQDVCQDSRR